MQLYAQPFVSSGDYSNWRELDNPRSPSYAGRFKPYSSADPGGFNVREFRSNAVVRWEYRPASTLFFVWQQGRSGNDPTQPNFDFGRDVNGVFGFASDEHVFDQSVLLVQSVTNQTALRDTLTDAAFYHKTSGDQPQALSQKFRNQRFATKCTRLNQQTVANNNA